ncbi:MAG: bifunctional (p)ppGpp synthetase/guanosine-3',5'-bis(diphosphate) 3'-pyrophosphohydrolase [Chloroflexi bacterium]|nr:bifunctional (p)ppGpp synthetase/guanosine-3',5'-bis(diphosphate) 3'-pyrophosphohydrolase [Chloroflexota bacterium]MCI0835792.1 bifunctional (p)ppGpp synthetase/guanosine-3',5'-bis(diphosphate) 3'-pyrophosphohydrolase [Chloroflexota bacterium]
MTISQKSGSSKALLKTIGAYLSADRADAVENALNFAIDSHHGQLRDSGEPFIEHPIATALWLAEMRLDTTTIQAALLHDVMEDCGVTFKELETDFGTDVAKLVDGVTKLKRLDMISENSAMRRQASTPEATRAASIRKMLVAMAEDVRVVLIKLSDRLHNMRTLKHLPVPKQQRISRETLDIYAPLAHRLGMNEIKWQLEDEAFRYLMPRQYKSISRLVNRKRAEREIYTEAAIKAIQRPLQKAGLKCSVEGRVKHLYSTYNKLQRYERIGRKFDEIYDLIAIRVIAESVGDCYSALGVVHSKWRPVSGQFDDYIASPKENMYQSLHTSVRGPGNYPIEVQIRTQDMHDIAEEGVASHWMYKGDDDGSPRIDNFDQKMSWLRQLVDWQRELSGDDEYLATVRTDILQDQVFVYTPQGDVKDLPAGATPIDFAYRIHTDLGHNTVGAVVNGKLTALNTQLQNGDVVEIRKARIPRGPSLDWLNPDLGYLVTGSARTKVKQWFRKQERQSNIRRGKDLLRKEMRRLGLNKSEKEIVAIMDYESLDELAEALGVGQISIARVAETISPEPDEVFTPEFTPGQPPADQTRGLVVMGEPGLITRVAKCCSPVYGDEITGYLTRGRGVTVHRRNCPILRDAKDPERHTPVAWGHHETTYASRLQIEAFDRVGLIRDITNVVSSENVNIHSLTSEEDEKTNACTVSLTVYTTGVEQLSRLFSRVETIPGVSSVFRVTEAQDPKQKELREPRKPRNSSS